MNKVRVAVVGAGFISSNRHLPAWRKASSAAKIVGLSDVNYDAVRKVADQFGIASVYRDAAEMIATEKPDVVDICTPPATHARIACTAIEQGAHVLIEKPMATTIPDCDAIVTAARRNGVQVCVGHSGLFYGPFIKARQMIARGVIGEFRGMRVVISTPTDYMTSNKDHWAHALPGGAIGETGPHAVYMSLAFINEVKSVTVSGAKLLPQYPWSQFEDYRINLIGHDRISSISVNYATNQWMVWVEIAGSEGTLQLDLHGRSVVRIRRPRLKAADIGLSVLGEAGQLARGVLSSGMGMLRERTVSTHDRLISAFADSLRDGKAAPVTAEEGREAVKVMRMIAEQLAERAEHHRPERLGV
jgi:2-alkyl-3-oxoalkanoate reductase